MFKSTVELDLFRSWMYDFNVAHGKGRYESFKHIFVGSYSDDVRHERILKLCVDLESDDETAKFAMTMLIKMYKESQDTLRPLWLITGDDFVEMMNNMIIEVGTYWQNLPDVNKI